MVAAGSADARRAAIATEHQAGADAGALLLKAGGSAVDAAIAAAAAVCVVHASSCGVGGGGFALVFEHTGRAHALDYRERAPARATQALYRDGDTSRTDRTRVGGLAVAVPGEIAGWASLHARFGRLPLATVLAPAVRLARDGFALADAPHLARQVRRHRDLLAADPGLRAIFLDASGQPPGDAFLIRNPDLARTIERVAREGTRAFYAGDTARVIAETVEARGGVLDVDDLARYTPVWRTPLTGTFHGRRIVTFPPPGSGAIVLTILGIVGHDDLPALGRGSPALEGLLAAAMARAFADRARHYGDPDFTEIPLDDLLAPDRLRALRQAIDEQTPALPAVGGARDDGTAHVSVIDLEGNAVSLTTTINTAFGAGVLVPGTGIILNNEMDDFVITPGTANIYGLSGTAANVIAPHKRPQSSMSPTIAVRDGRAELVVGGSGGPLIISGTTRVLLDHLTFGVPLPDAIAAPRLHDQGAPRPIVVEPGIPAAVRTRLRRGGRPVRELSPFGSVSAVGIDADGNAHGGVDRRKAGGLVVVP